MYKRRVLPGTCAIELRLGYQENSIPILDQPLIQERLYIDGDFGGQSEEVTVIHDKSFQAPRMHVESHNVGA